MSPVTTPHQPTGIQVSQPAALHPDPPPPAPLPPPPPTKYSPRVVEDYPDGLPRVAAFKASSDTFQIYRKFLVSRTRVLDCLQEDIRRIEEQIFNLDRDYDREKSKFNDDYLQSWSKENKLAPKGRRIKLIKSLQKCLVSYDSLLLSTHQIIALKAPDKKARSSVRDYLQAETRLVEDEMEYVKYMKSDLASLAPEMERGWVDDAVIWFIRTFTSNRLLKHVFANKEARSISRNDRLIFHTRWRVNIVISFLITVLITALLVVPVYLLFKITTVEGKTPTEKFNYSIAVLISSTFVMAMVMKTFTRAKRYETLAGAAAYCAVLVVFIGNIKGPGQN